MLEVPWLAVETNGTNWRVNSPSHFIFSLTLQQLFTSDFYPQAVNTQGKEAFAKELPMENKGMRFQKLFFLTFLWTYLPLRIYSLSFPLPSPLYLYNPRIPCLLGSSKGNLINRNPGQKSSIPNIFCLSVSLCKSSSHDLKEDKGLRNLQDRKFEILNFWNPKDLWIT